MNSRNYPILIVDDEESVSRALTRVLRDRFEDIESTCDPRQAMEMIQQKTYAMIISDQRMPNITGVELLLTAKELSPHTVRILISGYTDIGVLYQRSTMATSSII